DLLRLRIERCDLARRAAEWLVHHAGPQQVEPCRYALGLLQGETLEIALAHEILDCGRALGVEAERFERLPSEYERRLVCFAQLEIDALVDQLQSMAAVE